MGHADGVVLATGLVLVAAFIALYWRVMVGAWLIRDRPHRDEGWEPIGVASLAHFSCNFTSCAD